MVHLVIPRCAGASVAPQLVAELVQASTFVLIIEGRGGASCTPGKLPSASQGAPAARTFCMCSEHCTNCLLPPLLP